MTQRSQRDRRRFARVVQRRRQRAPGREATVQCAAATRRACRPLPERSVVHGPKSASHGSSSTVSASGSNVAAGSKLLV
jgi:hypothetical protein